MAAFACIALVLALAVFAGALWPLWRHAWKPTLALVLALCVGTFALYRIVGTPRALDPQTRVAQTPQPANASEPDALVEAAYRRMMADPQRRADAQSVQMLQRALQLDPHNPRGRWFFGVALRQQGHAAEAAELWQTLLADVDASTAQSLRVQIDAARKDAGMPPLPAPPTLAVDVSITPALRKRFGADASVFVIAREPGGSPMPVAVERHALSELPLTVHLDDGDSPMPTRKLSSLRQVEVLARLSASGDALHADAETPPVQISFPDNKAAIVVLGK